MSADSPRRSSRGIAVPATVPPQVVSDHSILDSAIGFINDVTLTNQPHTDPKDTITWARFESAADISDPRYGEDWELEGNVAPPLLLILGYGLGVQVWAIPANGEAVEVLSWRHGVVSALRVLPTPAYSAAIDENGRADEPVDAFAEKRPLIAMVDSSTSTGAPPQFSAVNFVSLKTGTQVKTIKFKNTVLDILANRSSIVITFNERIAVFDARTLEDRLSITTCYPSPGINQNPVALGPRWLAYAEHKLIPARRSGGGCDGDGVASYTATVLNAAKSFGKGLRELGEQVAAGLTGTTGSAGTSKNNSFDSCGSGDARQPGVVTIMDIKHPIKDYSPTSSTPTGHVCSDPIVAHFIAHSEAVVAMEFDNSGMLLLTADRRGHDFYIFRVQPHPVGSSLAAVHHLYVLHRGDTSAKVQNVAFSLDSRWAAVSTLRGTTHVFPITPYGGPMGVRTHTSLHVVNKLSRFHRSAGLSADGRSSSPISHSESTTFVQSLQPYHNPTLPPFPRPTVVLPLAQLRQPFALGSPPGSAALGVGGKVVGSGGSSGGGGSSASQRQRLSSLSDDNGKPLSVCAIFAKSRSWLLDPPNATREAPHRIQRKAVDSLFVMAGHGALIQYDLDTKLASNVAKEKICDDTPIELEVEAKAQWNLGRRRDGSHEIMPPLTSDNWLVKKRNSCMLTDSTRQFDVLDDRTESWLAQVEIITHAGPHRRLWMGPQCVFKTYNTPSGSNLNHVDAEAVEIGISKPAAAAAAATATRSSPLNMPLAAAGRSAVPVLIESGSYSSIEQSPKLMERFRHEHLDSDFAVAHGDSRLKEDLADAMRESPSMSAAHKDAGRLPSDAASSDNTPFYDALAEHDHDDDDDYEYDPSVAIDSHAKSAATLASLLPNIHSFATSSGYESLDSMRKPQASIAKVVNPLGTVTTVTAGMSAEVKTDILDEVVSQLAAEECVIHENCDESLFRPVVAIFCDENARKAAEKEDAARKDKGLCNPPEAIRNKLIVPVIAKEVDAELSKKEKQKSGAKAKLQQRSQEQSDREEQQKFAELSSLNRKTKGRGGSDVMAGRNAEQLQPVTVEVKNAKTEIRQEKLEASRDSKEGEQLKSAKVITTNIKAEIRQENIEVKQEKKSVDAKGTKEPAVVIKQEPLRKTAEEKVVEVSEPTAKSEKVAEAAKITLKARKSGEDIKPSIQITSKPEKIAEVIKATPKTEMDAEVIKATPKTEKPAEVIKTRPKTEKIVEAMRASSKMEKAAEVTKLSPNTEAPTAIIKATRKPEKDAEVVKTTPKLTAEMTAKAVKTAKMPNPAVEVKTKSNLTDEHDSVNLTSQQEEKILSKKAIDSSFKKETSVPKESKRNLAAETSVSREAEQKPAVAREKAEIAKVKPEAAKEKVEIPQEKPNVAKGQIVPAKDMPKTGKASPKKSSKKETPPDSEEEKVMEFKRMTPLPVEKVKKSCAESVSATEKTKPKEFTAIEIEKPKSLTTKIDNKEKSVVEKAKPVQETTNASALDPLKPLEPVEIFASPKKNKQKTVSKSNSGSETEEIIAVTPVTPRNSGQSLEKKTVQAKSDKKSSASSDDLADSLLEIKSQLGETMYISCTENAKEHDVKLKTRKSEILVAAEKLVVDVGKNVQPPSVVKVVERKEKNKEAMSKPTFKFGGIGNMPAAATDAAEAAELKAAEARSLFVFGASTDSTAAASTKKEKPAQTSTMQHKTYTFNVIDFPAPAPAVKSVKELPTAKSLVKKENRLCSETVQKQAEKPLEVAEKPESKMPKVSKTETASPKNNLTDAPKHHVAMNILPSMSLLRKTDVSSTSKKSTTKVEDAKVITEQPTAAKSSTVEKPAVTTVDKRETKVVIKTTEPAKNLKSATVTKDVTDGVKSATLSPKKSPKLPRSAGEILASAPAPVPCAWTTLSGAEMISKNLEKLQSTSAIDVNYPSLGAVIKSKKSPKAEVEAKARETTEKLLPDLPTPLKPLEDFVITSSAANNKQSKKCEQLVLDFEPLCPIPMEPMPPLPALEPLDIISPGPGKKRRDAKGGRDTPPEQLVLINFESPPKERSSTAPRGLTEENLGPALCGSLHYEDEGTTKGVDGSSLTHSNSMLGENDEQYMSLEQSSQETNTTNTATTNDKFSSSPNSSTSEEIIVLEEKKLSKKQRRKRLQNELVQHEAAAGNDNETNADEELRPLIAWSKSQWEQTAEPAGILPPRPVLAMVTAPAPSSPLARSTTTDSEGPMPATTSDDNVSTLPAALSLTAANAPNKLKTKKLEHKINLIAAIEAATSSSTSSAEESGVEAGGGRASDMDMSMLAVAQPTPAQASAAKKKTKRRFHFAPALNTIKCANAIPSSNSSINNGVDITDCNNKNNIKNQKSADTAAAMKADVAVNAPKAEAEDLTLSSIATHNSHCNTTGSTSIDTASPTHLNASDTSYSRYNAAGDGDGVGVGGEQNTIINIDSYDDQLSMSSIPSSSSPPLSLNGVFDANLMHFPAGGGSVDDDVGAYGDADGGSVDGDSGGGGSL